MSIPAAALVIVDVIVLCAFCLNYNEAYAPKQTAGQSICINGDTGEVIKELPEKVIYIKKKRQIEKVQ